MVSKILKSTRIVYKESGSKVTSDPAELIYNSSTPCRQVLEKLNWATDFLPLTELERFLPRSKYFSVLQGLV